MTEPLIIRRVGNSLAIIVTDIAEEMGLGEGDQLLAVQTERGFELTPYNSGVEKAVAAARTFMDRYPKAMKKLAE